jgi:calcium-dependent protein kinase
LLFHQIYPQLKSGAFATVCKGRNRSTGEPCAIKCIPRNALKPWDEVDILSEVSIMSKLSHPNIVQLIDFFAQPDCYLIVMDFCEGGDLFDRIGRRVDSIKNGNGTETVNKIGYSERDARDLCAVLLEVVRYCHEDMRLAHCDLKPRNLLLQVITDILVNPSSWIACLLPQSYSDYPPSSVSPYFLVFICAAAERMLEMIHRSS